MHSEGAGSKERAVDCFFLRRMGSWLCCMGWNGKFDSQVES